MRLRTDFDNVKDEVKYLKEQLDHWKKYPVSGLISGLVKMTSVRQIKNRLHVLTKNL